MKRLLYSAAALAMAFFAASCQQESLEPVVGSNTVTYTVQVPDALATKALGEDVANVNVVHYEVYRTVGTETVSFTGADRLLYHKTAPMSNGTATINLELVNDQNFTILFWAQVQADPEALENEAYNVSDLTNVTIKSGLKSNQLNYAAFSGKDFIKAGENLKGRAVSLTRPISQLNIATTKESLTGNGAFKTAVTLKRSSVTVSGLSNSFNVAKQNAGAEPVSTFSYSEKAVPEGEFDANHAYVAMNYVGFADNLGSQITVSYLISTSEGNIDYVIKNVPVKPNYRTNIVGNLITSTSDYTVTLDKTWGTPDEVYEIWDGKTKKEPSAVGNDYVIKTASEFAWLEAPRKLEYNVVLAGDIDMGGNAFKGILSNGKVFDGAGHTLKNVKLDYTVAGQSWSSLFVTGGGGGADSEINVKNLTVDGAYVVAAKSGNGNAAVIASYAEKEVVIDNVKVINSVVNGTQSIGALVGHVAANVTTIKNCEVDNVTLTTFDVPNESGNIGGVVGRVTGTCLIENTSISNSVINAYVNDGSMTDQKRTVSKYVGNFYGSSAVLTVSGGSIDNVTINHKNALASAQSCLYTEFLGGWRKDGGSVSINGIEILKGQTNDEITIDNAADLATAISNAVDGAVIPVSGTIPTTELKAGSGKNITIVGMSEDAVLDASAQSNPVNTTGNITFKNLTFKFSAMNDHYHCGVDADFGTVTFEDCKFEGIAVSDGSIIYNNCQFANTTEGKYAAWVYAGTVVYNDCSFKGVDRAVKVYGGSSLIKATYNNCSFVATKENDPSDPNKAGVEVTVKDYTSTLVVDINNPTIANTASAEHYGNEYFNIEAAANKGNGIVTLDGHTYAQLADGTVLKQVLQMGSESVTANLQNDVTIAGGTDAYGSTNTEVITVNGNEKKLTFEDGYRTYVKNAGGKFVLNNVNVGRSTTNTSTHFYDYNIALTDVELNNVKFERGINVDGDVVMNNVEIQQKDVDTYAMFVFIGSDVQMDECAIVTADDKGRGIKVTNEDRSSSTATTSLEVKNTSFDTYKKAAILVLSHTATDIVLDDVDITNVKADSVNPVWVDAAGAAYFDLVTVTGGTKVQEL